MLLEIENQFGRYRKELWRALRIELLLYHDLILHTSTLQIPDSRMLRRAFLLVLSGHQIAIDWIVLPFGAIKELFK